ERRHEEGKVSLGRLQPEVFHAVPVNAYPKADDKHHMVLAALKHISGNKRWPALNQARLLATLRDEEGMSPDEICQSVAISKNELTKALRALALSDAYRESEYGDQFSPDKYNLFREVTSSPDLRKWLNWDDRMRKAQDNANLDRLFSLVSTVEREDEDGGAPERRDPAITTGGNVRELARIIDDPKAMAQLEETRSLSEATLSSEVVLSDRVQKSLEVIDQYA